MEHWIVSRRWSHWRAASGMPIGHPQRTRSLRPVRGREAEAPIDTALWEFVCVFGRETKDWFEFKLWTIDSEQWISNEHSAVAFIVRIVHHFWTLSGQLLVRSQSDLRQTSSMIVEGEHPQAWKCHEDPTDFTNYKKKKIQIKNMSNYMRIFSSQWNNANHCRRSKHTWESHENCCLTLLGQWFALIASFLRQNRKELKNWQ